MYETILVAVDESDEAKAAFDHAVGLANSLDATVYVITVVETRANPMKFGVAEVDELDKAGATLIDEIVKRHGETEINGEVRRGKPTKIILEYAKEIDADVIFAGQQGEDGIAARVLGSTTNRLAQLTEMPFTIVPSPNVASETASE